VVQALYENGIEPPTSIFGASVGALDGAVLASRPGSAGADLLEQMWLSDAARDVFRFHTVNAILARFSGHLGILSPEPLKRLIAKFQWLTGCARFEDLQVPLQVVATDVIAGRPIVFRSGELAPALLASAAIPGVFPPVVVDGQYCSDGGVVDNMPIGLAVSEGYGRVLAIGLMGVSTIGARPASWSELLARTLQLTLHQRLLSDFERLKSTSRIVVICPLTPPQAAWDMKPSHVESLIEQARAATNDLLDGVGGALFRRSAIYYLDLVRDSHRHGRRPFGLADAG
jgi:NTE family protein